MLFGSEIFTSMDLDALLLSSMSTDIGKEFGEFDIWSIFT